MNRKPSVALICEGPINRRSLLRLAGLIERLHFIKSSSFRRASRVANTLRAGTPVHIFSELHSADIVLISTRPVTIEKTIKELEDSELSWSRKLVLIFGARSSMQLLRTLQVRGAMGATLEALGPAEDRRYLVEGQPAAVRKLRAILDAPDVHLIQIDEGAKPRFTEVIDRLNRQFIPMLSKLNEDLRSAGLTKSQADELSYSSIDTLMQAYFRSGRRFMERRRKARAGAFESVN